MAEALLAGRLARAGIPASVRSAGTLGEGEPPPPEAISAMAARGLDTRSHRSHQVSGTDLARVDLVLTMARVHLRHAVVTLPEVWSRAFTLKELVRRGEAIGARPAGEPLAGWLRRAHHGRDRGAMLGDCLDDDVADPIGGVLRAYLDTAVLLDTLVSRLVELAWTEGRSAGQRPPPASWAATHGPGAAASSLNGPACPAGRGPG